MLQSMVAVDARTTSAHEDDASNQAKQGHGNEHARIADILDQKPRDERANRNAAVEQNARQYGCFFAKDNKNRFPNDGKAAFVQVFSSMTVWILDLTSAASSTVFMS